MPMMKSEIFKFINPSITQKSKYPENETFFFLKKNHSVHIKDYHMAKNSFLAEVITTKNSITDVRQGPKHTSVSYI